MHNPEYQAKFTITDIQPKTDKNFNPYYLLHFVDSKYNHGYAFKNSVESQTLNTLSETPEKLVNQRVNITYSLNYLANQTFLQIKQISLIN